jgi:hypothetical protein
MVALTSTATEGDSGLGTARHCVLRNTQAGSEKRIRVPCPEIPSGPSITQHDSLATLCQTGPRPACGSREPARSLLARCLDHRAAPVDVALGGASHHQGCPQAARWPGRRLPTVFLQITEGRVREINRAHALDLRRGCPRGAPLPAQPRSGVGASGTRCNTIRVPKAIASIATIGAP